MATERKETIVTNRAKDPNASGANKRASTSVPAILISWDKPWPVIKVRTLDINLPDARGRRESCREFCGMAAGETMACLNTPWGNWNPISYGFGTTRCCCGARLKSNQANRKGKVRVVQVSCRLGTGLVQEEPL